MDYTIIGKEVNLASRFESKAEPGEILVSHETWALIKDKIICRERGEARVKVFEIHCLCIRLLITVGIWAPTRAL